MMNIYLVQEKLRGNFTGSFFVVCKETEQDVENWIVNSNFNISDNYSYTITDISGYSGILRYVKEASK